MEEVKVDPIDALITMEGIVWNLSSLTNPTLWDKMCSVAHTKTMNILSYTKLPFRIETDSYKSTYFAIFKALVDKKLARKTSDSRASMPSVMGLYHYMSNEDATSYHPTNHHE